MRIGISCKKVLIVNVSNGRASIRKEVAALCGAIADNSVSSDRLFIFRPADLRLVSIFFQTQLKHIRQNILAGLFSTEVAFSLLTQQPLV